MAELNKTVLVAMSGGVDSSVAAFILKQKGYAVEGLTMLTSSSTKQAADASRVAKKLGIKHNVVDVSGKFGKKVIEYFYREYKKGRTPNPCVRCNQHIKFGLLLSEAVRRNCFFATGHYARIVFSRKRNEYDLKKGVDGKKDQSYVLYVLSQRQLARTLLPLGNCRKEDIRKIAGDLDLPVNSEESQDICFIPDRDYVSFLRKRFPDFSPKAGDIVGSDGKIMGRHSGIDNYTIGQRKGLGIAYHQPLFVLRFDLRRNQVVVGTENELYRNSFEVSEVAFNSEKFKKKKLKAKVKIRYRHTPAQAVITHKQGRTWKVEFLAPEKAITPGQAAVFYDQDRVVGGGIITRVLV